MTTAETLAIIGACIAGLGFILNALGGLALFVRIGRLLESHDNLRKAVDDHVETDLSTHGGIAVTLREHEGRIERLAGRASGAAKA